jgi:hypothetical protein
MHKWRRVENKGRSVDRRRMMERPVLHEPVYYTNHRCELIERLRLILIYDQHSLDITLPCPLQLADNQSITLLFLPSNGHNAT